MKIRSVALSPLMWLAFCVVVTPVVAEVASDATDSRPEKQAEIESALERGNTLRTQAEIVPGALQNCSLILKRNGVRCGHAYMSILGARGETGATYHFSLQLKAAMAQEDRAIIVQTDGSFLLRNDLSLLSGEMTQHSDWQERSGNGGVLYHRSIKISNAPEADELRWEVSEQGINPTDPAKVTQHSIALKTFKPMPSEVLVALAAFAAKKNMPLPGLVVGTSKGVEAVCVPILNLLEMPNMVVRPAWISFLSADKELVGMSKIAEGDLLSKVRIRYLSGGLTADGLKVLPPTPEEWKNTADYGVNERQRVVALPKPADVSIVFEAVDSAKLNPQEPFEFTEILKSYDPSYKAPAKNPDAKAAPKQVPDPAGCPVR